MCSLVSALVNVIGAPERTGVQFPAEGPLRHSTGAVQASNGKMPIGLHGCVGPARVWVLPARG